MIKKVSLLFTLILIVFISGCNEGESNNIMFNNEELTYINELDNGYTLYRSNNAELEAKLIDNESINASYVLDEDIYIITGEIDSFLISKNGSTVLSCSGEEIICSGIENLDFKDDVANIYIALHIKEVYTFQIIGSIVVLISIVIFIIPLRLVKLFNKRARNYNLLPIRILAMIIFLVGFTIILTL